jgi:hypothetical protein
MARVTSQQTRRFLLVTGDPLDPDSLPERVQLYDENGEPLSIPLGHRRVVSLTTADLDPAADTGKFETRKAGEGESGTWDMGVGVLLTRIVVDKPCRVRLYTQPAKRDADVDRDRFTDPMDYPEPAATPNHGCLSEFLLLTQLVLENIPADYLVSGGGEASIYYRIDNYDLTAGPVTVSLTIKDVEQ